MTSVMEIAGVSRAEAATRAWAKAVDRAHRLEVEAQGTFVELHAAQEFCADEGMRCDLELSGGIAAAFAEWKQKQATAEARQIAREA